MHKLGLNPWNIHLLFRLRSALVHLVEDIINQEETAYVLEINSHSEVLWCRSCGEVMGSWLGLFRDSSPFIIEILKEEVKRGWGPNAGLT